MIQIAIFDLDGTLADGTHREHHIQGSGKKDWKQYFLECDGDKPIWDVIQVLLTLHYAGWCVEIWSGRSDMVKDKTVKWLQDVGIPQIPLHMRGKNDYRDDRVVKGEMLEAFTRRTNRIPTIIFDDRNKMVDFWRERGITCAQTAPGDF